MLLLELSTSNVAGFVGGRRQALQRIETRIRRRDAGEPPVQLRGVHEERLLLGSVTSGREGKEG